MRITISQTKGRYKRMKEAARLAGYDDVSDLVQETINVLADDRELSSKVVEWFKK